ncbi:hypothetical protein SAMN05661096_01032 [Marivirga sericea]|uniref:Uncharacterized protein n=1 Tax=Marivirga sericea TaxID=1028 RepID=A0A1X7ITC7_9BACT|nr:hypothetical protein SAMN05661096_01032 [Marivirga sericea]
MILESARDLFFLTFFVSKAEEVFFFTNFVADENRSFETNLF